MTKSIKEKLFEYGNAYAAVKFAAGFGVDSETTQGAEDEVVADALKEIEAIIEAAYDNLPSLDKLTVGNEMSDGYDQGVEAFRQATIKALYGKED